MEVTDKIKSGYLDGEAEHLRKTLEGTNTLDKVYLATILAMLRWDVLELKNKIEQLEKEQVNDPRIT